MFSMYSYILDTFLWPLCSLLQQGDQVSATKGELETSQDCVAKESGRLVSLNVFAYVLPWKCVCVCVCRGVLVSDCVYVFIYECIVFL